MRNLEDYVSLTVDATVKSGISRQVEAFISGFNQVSRSVFIVVKIPCSRIIKPCKYASISFSLFGQYAPA